MLISKPLNLGAPPRDLECDSERKGLSHDTAGFRASGITLRRFLAQPCILKRSLKPGSVKGGAHAYPHCGLRAQKTVPVVSTSSSSRSFPFTMASWGSRSVARQTVNCDYPSEAKEVKHS